VSVGSPSIRIAGAVAQTLSLLVHELATNAVKYGALSNGTGQVRLSWELVPDGDRQKVTLTWQETGGPPVAVPTRKGFGSRLIESTSDGEGAIDYRADGVRCQLNLDL
jgi:two-component sensor histidine kinase